MTTLIRAEISQKNKHWIDKHRHYELKHFCMQYPDWKRAYAELDGFNVSISSFERTSSNNTPSDPTSQRAIKKAHYADRIKMVEKVAMETDKYLYEYIIRGVTEERSYTYLKTVMGMPCGKDMYYDRYRRFFKLLSEKRG